jgi:hypothetical protein
MMRISKKDFSLRRMEIVDGLSRKGMKIYGNGERKLSEALIFNGGCVEGE